MLKWRKAVNAVRPRNNDLQGVDRGHGSRLTSLGLTSLKRAINALISAGHRNRRPYVLFVTLYSSRLARVHGWPANHMHMSECWIAIPTCRRFVRSAALKSS
jgi:hypothetical protein